VTGAFDWSAIRLVVFDVDGTLYAQRPLRLQMAARLLLYSAVRRDRHTLRVLKTYRTHREELGDAEQAQFEEALVAEVARRHDLPTGAVETIVAEWMERRPLPHLARCRYPSVDTLFERIRRSGRTIGILSDYPAIAKLAALGLEADLIVHAGEVGYLKPHPMGLQRLIDMAKVSPAETVLIGDRAERDGEAARRAGAHCLLRSERPIPGYRCFARFDDAVFDGLSKPLGGC
jgi:HAD superfamily hydrolase (TIGR01509 family)